MYPSRVLKEFIESKTYSIPDGKALDMGSGKGRNSIFLAQHGFEVEGVEFASSAVKMAQETVKKENLNDKVHFIEQSVGEPLPFKDENFSLIIDMMTMHLLNAKEREMYAGEVVRLLKPNGYFVFYTILAESPAAQDLFKSSPGPEPNSYIVPQSQMIEKTFTHNELQQMFKPLKVIKLEPRTQTTSAFGDVYERTYCYGIMTKKS
jgi:ubiquinone/menaquinone biosynthesis C-methylase UbiE